MKKIVSILLFVVLCLSMVTLAGAEGISPFGTSLPTQITTESYNGTLNSLGESPLSYSPGKRRSDLPGAFIQL